MSKGVSSGEAVPPDPRTASHGPRERLERSAEELLVTQDSDRQPKFSFVLPTMNEEEGIGHCIDQIREAIEQLQYPAEIIVSDSSTDRTPEIASEQGAIVVQPDEEGYGYAYRYGFQFARGEYIVMGDADTTYDFTALPRLFERMQTTEADMVLGSRFEGEIKSGAMPPLHRYVGNPLLTRFLNTFYDTSVTDAHSGFRIFRREALQDLDLCSNGMEFASEMLMSAAVEGLQIEEVPIVYHDRVGEETLDSLSDGWRHVKFMLKNAPDYLFALPSLWFTTVGVIVMLLSLTGHQYFTIVFSDYTMLGGSFLTLVGYQVGCLSVYCSMVSDAIREPEDRVTKWIREHVSLEYGASIGLVLFCSGMIIIGYLSLSWVASGFSILPPLVWAIVGFTLAILGLQTVFNSFFLSILAENVEQTDASIDLTRTDREDVRTEVVSD